MREVLQEAGDAAVLEPEDARAAVARAVSGSARRPRRRRLKVPRRFAAWRGTDAWRAEAAELDLRPDGVVATGVQVGAAPVPYRLDYRLDASAGWVTGSWRRPRPATGGRAACVLARDGRGGWSAEARRRARRVAEPVDAPGGDPAALAGALDCDLGFSPLTNLLPVRRLGLLAEPGVRTTSLTAWVAVPALTVEPSPQRYALGRRSRAPAVRFSAGGTSPPTWRSTRTGWCSTTPTWPPGVTVVEVATS